MASESGETGPSQARQQGSTPVPSKDTLPPYPSLERPAPGYQHNPPKKRRRPSSNTDIQEDSTPGYRCEPPRSQQPSQIPFVEEDHIALVKRLVDMYGSMEQEVRQLKEEWRATRQELHEVK